MKYAPALLESTKSEIIKLLSVIEDMQNDSEEDYACKKMICGRRNLGVFWQRAWSSVVWQ